MSVDIDDIAEWDLDVWTDPFFEVLGPVFPLAVAIFVIGTTYIYTRSAAMPTVLAILLGGSMITLLPATAQNVGWLLVYGGIAAAIWMVFEGGGRAGGRL